MIASSGSGTPAAVELAPARLYALGANVPVDGRTSWVPLGQRGFQSNNGYLLLDGTEALLIDTGLAANSAIIVRQLESVIAPGTNLSIFLTRPEYDCLGGLSAIAKRFPIQCYTTGLRAPNLPECPDYVTDLEADPFGPGGRVELRGLTETLTVAPGRIVDLYTPLLRSLVTYWAYDRATQTLFTSDCFTHACVKTETGARIVEQATDDQDMLARLPEHLRAKFWWVAVADLPPIARDLTQIFETYDVATIAPTHGAVLHGREVVRRHYDRMLESLGAVR
jgi:flavorubredoxin